MVSIKSLDIFVLDFMSIYFCYYIIKQEIFLKNKVIKLIEIHNSASNFDKLSLKI
jgi:hypothetical protein